jgi:hypothetical protein
MRRRSSVVRAAAPYLVILAIAPSVWGPRNAHATWVESLVMPGEVVAKHARIERECAKCHAPFDKAAQDGLCLACHTDVATDLSEKHGMHGQVPSVQGHPCKTCHTEHKGRGADIVHLDRTTFEHRFTDLQLRGAHTRVPCDACHVPGKRYRDASSRCSDCHARKDPHEGCLGAACEKCHNETAWTAVRFDHAATAFPLAGRHRDTRCERCHLTKRYKPTASKCSACHERNDKHHGHLGSTCESCHTPSRWSGTAFNHSRQTQFPLLGGHARVSCENCHRDGIDPKSTPTACYGCHERSDAHRAQFGRLCETCHTPVNWQRYTFEHDRSTRYPLRGRHRQVRCTDCHRGELHVERLDTNCNACHRNDDVHHGRQGTRCDSCHDERGWSRDVLFDHDSTHFPLTGAHTRVACMRCHVSPVFKKVARECVSCHERDAAHRCQRGADCERCHETSNFRVIRAPQ